jgi:hypothetical protein
VELDADAIVFLAISVVAAFYMSFRFLRHTRLMEDMPTSRVRSAHQGYVELEGTSRLIEGTTITAPLTLTGCVWWFYEIEKKVRSGKRTSWSTIDKKSSPEFFHLEDETGACVIDPAGADVITAARRVWYGSSPWPADTKSSIFGNYRYTERLIKPGARVYALGMFNTRSTVLSAEEERAGMQEKLGAWKQDPERMKLLDVNRDGNIDVKEWEAARRVALVELRREHATTVTEGTHMLSLPGLKGQPYILSEVLQKDLCRRWRIYALLCFAWFLSGGAILVSQFV